ncbi:4-hydroxy-3-methylbut-2-enyl diphosphate reductase [Saccharicrinis sp. FJH2]|uniref:4-hydroxy-3-methylbut-2-enyl diphosphate reductase n=1 Tax=Saccharicrinis sp. FJH65 TaxID=3344659 RepID=UPI0035F3BCDA
MAYKIEIDGGSGFCFGVVNAIKKAEDVLTRGEELYCLGDIVHNSMEVERLEKLGLKTIDYNTFKTLKNVTVLLRAHGEPPSTYETAQNNNITLIDATCPVVLQLQKRVKKGFESAKQDNGLVVIYGKKGHAEVNGLVGQTDDEAVVVENEDDLDGLNFNQPIYLYSQTTKQEEGLLSVEQEILNRLGDNGVLEMHNSICKQVSRRVPGIKQFAKKNDLILFVSGKKSSNGKMLFEACKSTNPDSYFISSVDELDYSWLKAKHNIGICGATSTPRWLMDEVAEKVKEHLDLHQMQTAGHKTQDS